MVNPNLHFLISFLQEQDIQKLIAVGDMSLCPAEEIDHEYSRAVESPESSDFNFYLQINPKVLKILSPDEKVRIYEILRIISVGTDSGVWKYVFDDYNNLLRKRGFHHERYFYLNSLTDDQFCYEIDCILTKNSTPRRRNFYRRIKSKYLNNTKTLEEIILEYFKIKIVKVKKSKPKRLIRHKGYRDRGSLGAKDQDLLDDIYSDVWVADREERRKRQTSDFLELLHGFSGLI